MDNNTHTQIYIPEPFKKGKKITQLILISDVDGVIRDSVDAKADPRIIAAIKSLLSHNGVDVTFISGTSIHLKHHSEEWRRSNLSLNEVFGSTFENELSSGKVSIFGVLGGHHMNPDGSLKIVDEYSPEISNLISKLLLQAFLHEVINEGSEDQKVRAHKLFKELDSFALHIFDVVQDVLAKELEHVINEIHTHFDPEFRLINRGTFVETHTSNPPWHSQFSAEWLAKELERPEYPTSRLTPSQKHIANGVAKKDKNAFNFLLISKTDKGQTITKHIENKLKLYPDALIVTIGDTQVDFPMHKNAHLAFHVGSEKVWRNSHLKNCLLIRNERGADFQHVEGTLKVLEILQEGLDKSFFDLEYVQRLSKDGSWPFTSLNSLNR